MAIRVVRLGNPRLPEEGSRIGTVRRPPRGVRKEDYARGDYFDVWLPELAPSAPLVSWALSEPFTPRRWANYKRHYLSEMRKSPAPDCSYCWLRFQQTSTFQLAVTAPTNHTAIDLF
jgi:uncharacterized protein YeaO (DUF488 family)